MNTNNSPDAYYNSVTTAAIAYAREFIRDWGYDCNAATWRDIEIDIREGIAPLGYKFEDLAEYLCRQLDNSPNNSDPDNSQPAGTIYDNPLQVLQAYDTTALDSLTEEQQQYLDSFLDFESYAFTVDSNSVTIWDPIGWDVLETCTLEEFVINSLREARDAEPAE